jgi:hypothetical protein
MSSRSSTQKPAKGKRWRIVIMRNRGQVLGIVEAPARHKSNAMGAALFRR